MSSRAALIALTFPLILALPACKREDRDPDRVQERVLMAGLPPLDASAPTSTLQVSGFGDAVVALPMGTTKPVPVVVAVLGIGDTPDDQCATWQEITGPRAFVLCPRFSPYTLPEEVPDASISETDSPEQETPAARPAGGRFRQLGFLPVDLTSVEREVSAALDALKSAYGAYVSEGEMVFAGFSRGAFIGVSLAAKHPQLFSRLVLIEGGHSPWHEQRVAAFARGGGKRVLFACGQASCVGDAEPASTLLRTQNIETRVIHGVGEGHGYRKQVKEELRRTFDWVIEGDPRWRDW